jgi:hypothetical protein
VSDQSNIFGPSSAWEPTNKSISIRTTTWKRLQKYIHYGNTFDSVIRDLLDEKERIIDSDMQEGVKN